MKIEKKIKRSIVCFVVKSYIVIDRWRIKVSVDKKKIIENHIKECVDKDFKSTLNRKKK